MKREKRSCINCAHLVVTIPVCPPIRACDVITPKSGRLSYQRATARCRMGYLSMDNGKDHVVRRPFEGSAPNSRPRELKLYTQAERCTFYKGMI